MADEFRPVVSYSKPLRTILHWCLSLQGHQIIHGGAVGFEEGGIILTGKSGSGKSTTALACLQSNLMYAGEENVVLEEGIPPFVHSLYNSVSADDESLSMLPFLNEEIGRERVVVDGKYLFFLNEQFPDKML